MKSSRSSSTSLTLLIALVALALALVATAKPASAQKDRKGIALRVSPGVALTTASFGDDDPRSEGALGLTLGGQLLIPISSGAALHFEGVWQPYKIQNPHFDEAFRTTYLMGGIEISTKGAYLRPSVGVAMRTWSGQFAPETGTPLAFGLAFGFERPISNSFHVSPELNLRVAWERGLGSLMLGLQVPVGWRSGG